MGKLAQGARQLPTRHLSMRVPWNDIGWAGTVCNNPAHNVSCLVLKRIHATRNDNGEQLLAGKSWQDLSQSELPPCVSEHGHFMAPFELYREVHHPYVEISKAHKHILPTSFRHAPFSAAAVPFNWMLRDSAEKIVKDLELDFQPELEAQTDKLMGYETTWVQSKPNQLVMLDTFFGAIQPEESLVFFYAKRTPLVDDIRRVLIGVGRVTHVGQPTEYSYSEPGPLTSVLWERNIQHSIRDDFKDGFILPYHEIIRYLEEHPEEDPQQFVAFVPDDQFWAFSYGSEHVTNDGAIGSLLACIKAIQNIQKVIPGKWEQTLQWLDARLNELWQMRGPCPGLGSALSALGLENGSLVAFELEKILAEKPETRGGDPWPLVDRLFKEPDSFSPEVEKQVGKTLQAVWHALSTERRSLLKLLSRFELTAEQATRFYVHEDKQRSQFRIDVKDSDLLANPYRLYEADRFTENPINLALIDRGIFPDKSLRDKFPLPEPSKASEALDSRRVCAFVVRQLENAKLSGHTLQPRNKIVEEIRELDVQPQCPVTGDVMAVVEASFAGRVQLLSMNDNEVAYQLTEVQKSGEVVSSSLARRIKGVRHSAKIDWNSLLSSALPSNVEANDDHEAAARQEKVAALEEIFASRFSVLVGPAGTGKTTLLKTLVSEPSVAAGGVLLLAPTGKARVRMDTQTGLAGAQTIAQFLLPLDRYEPTTGNYRLSKIDGVSAYKTVVIDEASMLTEDQLAAIVDAVKSPERIILVGDPSQLPPIGAGRPFVDIVLKLKPQDVDSIFPRIGPGYTELTVRRRQIGSTRDDLLLAEWFSGRPLDPGADEIWEKIHNGQTSKELQLIEWQNGEELHRKLLETLVKELNLKGVDDYKEFEKSIGGSEYNNNVYFWASKPEAVGAGAKAEDWEILTPIRNSPFGVDAINRLIQTTFRAKTKESALRRFGRKIPKPMGSEEILYGDKVIQTKNQRRFSVYPKDNAQKYVANGEIGVAVGQFKTQYMKFTPYGIDVEFSSQLGFKYLYWGRDFAEDGDRVLELAYALTVHKTQGSEFGLTLVVIPDPCFNLSRELLYTALTRQKNRIIVFHQGQVQDLKKYSEDYFSESATRLTNLMNMPSPVLVNDKTLEGKLIHRTARGLCVQSKSELIIATELDHAGIQFEYNSKFIGQDGNVRFPDFVIDDAESGRRYFWEHLGMLQNSDYKQRWEKKLAWYRKQEVLPLEDGGGQTGTLVTTSDHLNGGIDVAEIHKIIKQISA